jgi:hypothetical protein
MCLEAFPVIASLVLRSEAHLDSASLGFAGGFFETFRIKPVVFLFLACRWRCQRGATRELRQQVRW